MKIVSLGELIRPAGSRAGSASTLPVFSVTKHAGFVKSAEYFKKQVFSRDTTGYKVVEPGQFAYATIHLDEGSIGVAPEAGLISPMYTVFAADSDRVDSGYLIRYLKSHRALEQYARMGNGAVHRRKAISLDALSSLPVPLPRLGEQRRITGMLDTAEAALLLRRGSLDRLLALERAMLDRQIMPGLWREESASEIMPRMRNGLSPSSAGDFSARVLTLAAITRGYFDPASSKSSLFVGEPPADQRVTDQDFLICRGNGKKTLVGMGAFSKVNRPDLVFPDTIIAGRVDARRADMRFLAALWNHPATRSQIEAAARTTNGTFKVNQQALSAIALPLPPLEVQQEIAARLEKMDEQRALVQRALDLDNELFASLQHRAFSGML